MPAFFKKYISLVWLLSFLSWLCPESSCSWSPRTYLRPTLYTYHLLIDTIFYMQLPNNHIVCVENSTIGHENAEEATWIFLENWHFYLIWKVGVGLAIFESWLNIYHFLKNSVSFTLNSSLNNFVLFRSQSSNNLHLCSFAYCIAFLKHLFSFP